MFNSSVMKFYVLLPIVFLLSCSNSAEIERKFIFLGHTYEWGDSTRIDKRLEQLDFSNYDQIWLGGDISSHTTLKKSTVTYIDSIFDLDSEQTHWALGNHDVMHGNIQYITDRTKRNTFYSSYFERICLLVLNTNLFHIYPGMPPQEDCAEKEAQLNLIQSVCDSISEANHLIILHHLALLNELRKDADGQANQAFNMNAQYIRASCDSTSDFTATVYPWLTKVQDRGIQVTLIGGDLGMQAKQYEFTTKEGIKILGSGINNSVNPKYAPEYVKNFDPDRILIVRYFPESGKLDWDFQLLNDLLDAGSKKK